MEAASTQIEALSIVYKREQPREMAELKRKLAEKENETDTLRKRVKQLEDCQNKATDILSSGLQGIRSRVQTGWEDTSKAELLLIAVSAITSAIDAQD